MDRLQNVWRSVCPHLLVVTAALSTISAHSQDLPKLSEEPVPQSMGSFGDSISAGMFANFSRSTANVPFVEVWFVLRSLTAGALFQLRGLEKRSFAWAAGDDATAKVISHARRIASLNPSSKLKVYNVAHSGAESSDVLATQLPLLNNWSRDKLKQEYPDYVTMLIGANDACADSAAEMVPTNVYYQHMEQIVGQVLAKSPKTHLLISSLPNIETLHDVAQNAKLWGWGLLKSCKDVWKRSGICKTLTTEADPVERAKVAQRLADYNMILRDVVARYQADYGDRVRVANSVFEVPLTADDISMDCFHPNPSGQGKLSSYSWKQSWWGQTWSQASDDDLRTRIALKNRCDNEFGLKKVSPKYVISTTCTKWSQKSAEYKNVGLIDLKNGT